jgi:hypothetical protein
MILVARAPATTWDVQRTQGKTIRNLAKKTTYVNHYSFHIVDPIWGHVTIKMSGHPPFGAQVILNGHEYVATTASAAGVIFTSLLGSKTSCHALFVGCVLWYRSSWGIGYTFVVLEPSGCNKCVYSFFGDLLEVLC